MQLSPSTGLDMNPFRKRSSVGVTLNTSVQRVCSHPRYPVKSHTAGPARGVLSTLVVILLYFAMQRSPFIDRFDI